MPSTATTKETYIGLCDTTFKLRYRNHICSFRNERYKHATELNKYVWSLKDRNIAYNIKWRKLKQAKYYSNVNKRCSLCLWEKFFILCRPETSTLNRRNELASCCRHAWKMYLLSGDTSRNVLDIFSIVLYFQISSIVTVFSDSCLMIALHRA